MGRKPTAGELERIEALLRDGCAASEIAAIVGGRTRNAIIGIVHRHLKHIGFKRPAPKMVDTVRKRRMLDRKRLVIAERAMMEPEPVEEIMPPPDGVSMADLRSHQCRWPLWPNEVTPLDDKRYCGAKIERGSYCDRHARASYTALGVRR